MFKDWAVGESHPTESGCKHKRHENMKIDTVLIDSCGCAVLKVHPSGAVEYDFDLLVEHFAEHEGRVDDDDAVDWVSYNVIRGLSYVTTGIKPLVTVEGDPLE